jgi:macrodomain Ter protein organizer (MatP/YcbG family)
MSPTRRRRSKLRTTTIRLDWDLWERASEVADDLGIGLATVVHNATREYVVRFDQADRMTQLEQQVSELMRTVASLSRRLRDLFRGRS